MDGLSDTNMPQLQRTTKNNQESQKYATCGGLKFIRNNVSLGFENNTRAKRIRQVQRGLKLTTNNVFLCGTCRQRGGREESYNSGCGNGVTKSR